MSPAHDVVIIGGGVAGASIAFELARRRLDVALVEKESICAGPTARSCGIVRQHYSHPILARMALEGLRVFQTFAESVGGECEFHRTGFLLTAREDTYETLAANVAMQRSVGIDTRLVSPQEMRDIEPHIDLEGIVGGAYEPQSGYADAYATTLSYATRARELGVEIHTGTRVTAIETDGDRVTGVSTTDGPIAAAAVVVAAGPWAASLLEPLGIALPTEIGRVQVGLFDRPRELATHGVFADTSLGVYARPESDGIMLVGSIETTDAELTVRDPDRYDEGMDFDRVTSYSERISRRYPAMTGGRFHDGYASLYDLTPDWQPILGPLPGAEGLYGSVGSSGHGFKLAPVVARLLADLVVGEPVDPEILELFSLDRFDRGARADGRYGGHKILG